MSTLSELLKSLSGVTDVSVLIRKLRSRSNNNNLEAVDSDSLLDASVEHGVLRLRVAANEDEKVSVIDTSDSRVHQILATEVSVEERSIGADIEVITVNAMHKVLVGHSGLEIGELTNLTLNLLARRRTELLSGKLDGLLPGELSEGAVVLAGKRNSESLLLETIEGVSRLVTDPLLIDLFVNSGKNTKQVRATSVSLNVGGKTVHGINSVGGLQLPRSSLERVGQIVKGADGAEVNNVTGQLVGDHALNISGDLVDLTTADLTEGELTGNLLSETYTSGAMNASRHRSLDKGTEVLVLNGTLVFSEAALLVAING